MTQVTDMTASDARLKSESPTLRAHPCRHPTADGRMRGRSESIEIEDLIGFNRGFRKTVARVAVYDRYSLDLSDFRAISAWDFSYTALG